LNKEEASACDAQNLGGYMQPGGTQNQNVLCKTYAGAVIGPPSLLNHAVFVV